MHRPCNVGPRERYLRFALAAATGAAALTRPRGSASRHALAAVAAAEAITAATRYCPLNAALGIDNCHATPRATDDAAPGVPPAPERSRSATVGGVAMRWEEHPRGGGVPVVMVHGIPTHPRLWRHVVPRIDGAHLLAWEMVGFGWSIPAGLGRDVSIAAQAGYLRAWLDHLGIDRAVFVGHDLGGGVVQRFAVAQPDRVIGLVLADCVAYGNWPVTPVRMARLAAGTGVVDHVPPRMLKPAFFRALRYLGHDRADRRLESAALHWRPYDRPEGPAGFSHQLRSLDADDTLAVAPRLPELGRRGVPAHVVWGTQDPLGLASARRLASDLRAPLRRIDGGRHFTPEDHPDELAHAIRDVLGRAAAADDARAFATEGTHP